MSLILPRSGWRQMAMVILLACCVVPGVSKAQAVTCNADYLTVNFGAASGNGTAVTAWLTLHCTSSLPRPAYTQFCIHVGPGDFSSGQATRRMSTWAGSGEYINYDLFADPGRTQLIGPVGSVLTYHVSQQLVSGYQDFRIPLYGWIYPGQSFRPQRHYELNLQVAGGFRYDTASYPNSTDCSTGGAGGGLVSGAPGHAETTPVARCTISASDLDFGHVPPPQSPMQASASVRVSCPASVVWEIGLDNGQHFDGSMRRMTNVNGDTLKYQLYSDVNRTVVWDSSSNRVGGTTNSTGDTVSVTIYGQIPAQPDAAAGSYVDTVVATLYY